MPLWAASIEANNPSATQKVIKDTFALQTVPKEALNIGLAGVLPYLATSAATVYCALEMNHSATHGTGWLLNEVTAEGLLHLLEPIQVGYGAVVRFPATAQPTIPN